MRLLRTAPILAFATLSLFAKMPLLPEPSNPNSLTPPHGLNIVDWKQIRAEYERHRYGAFPEAGGGLQARSFEQQWLAHFDGRGFTVVPDQGGWRWGLELAGAAGKAQAHTEVNRISYLRAEGLQEWYLNDTRGLEHGFTLNHPTASIRLNVRGNLSARATVAQASNLWMPAAPPESTTPASPPGMPTTKPCRRR